MAAFSRLLKYFGIKEGDIDKKLTDAIKSAIITGKSIVIDDSASDYIKYGYQGNADIYAIVSRYITMSRQAKLVLKKKVKDGKPEIVTDHQLTSFLKMANPTMSIDDFREAYTIFRLITGNVFFYKPLTKDGINKGKPTQLYILPSDSVQVESNNQAIFTPDIKYSLANSKTDFTTEEIYHSKNYNPAFYSKPTLFGQSPLQAAATILSKQIEAEKTQANQFKNSGPAYMLFREGEEAWSTLSDKQKLALEKEINGLAAKGKQGSGLVMKDKFGVIKLGISVADMNVIASAQDGRRVLCNVYKLPVGLFNDPSGSTYNNISTARKAAWTDAIMPHNNKFADDLTQCLIYPVEEYRNAGLFFDMDYSGVEELQTGIKEKVDWMIRAHWTANEIREATGREPIDAPEMNEPIFSNGDALLSDLEVDLGNNNKNYGDYK